MAMARPARALVPHDLFAADNLAAQRAGRQRWYRAYRVRVCRVEREYGFERDLPDLPSSAR